MEEITLSNYNFFLVLLSFITSIASSYAAFDLLSRASGTKGKKKLIWIISSGFILGMGMWSMHFIGVCSIRLPFPIEYRLINVFLSLLVAILLSFLSLLVIVREKSFNYQYSISGIIVVFGFNASHYIGMTSLHVHYLMEYTNYISLFAILFSWLFATLSYKEFRLNVHKQTKKFGNRIKIALLMGTAICGSHYINQMAAKMIEYVEHNPYQFPVINPTLLGIMMTIGTCLIVAVLLLTSSFDRKLSHQSERRQLSEQYYRSLYEQNPDVILTFDLEGRFISANKAVSLFGYAVEELINKTFVPLIVPKDVEKAMDHFYLAINGHASTFECSIFDKQGKHREITVTDIPIYVNEKVTGVYSIVKDITEYVTAQRNLVEAEAKYRSLVENSQVGVYIIQNEKFVYVNPRLCEIYGYTCNELLALSITDIIYPDDLPDVKKNLIKLLIDDRKKITYQFRAQSKDNRILTLEIYASRIEYNGSHALIGTTIDITERIQTEMLIKHMAYHDQLTDLPNRYLLKETLEKVINTSRNDNRNFALLFLDLDRFKMVNDTLGHEIGDKLLVELAERIRGCVKETDLIARLGGDEFAILLPNSTGVTAKKVARRVSNAISTPFHLNHNEILITPSIGISIFPYHGKTREVLMKHADLAMYYAKSQGKNNYQTFTQDLIGKSQQELDIEMNLRKALERNEFVLYYQPQINIETNKIIGAESLIRWQHPEKGIIPPDEFIPFAEETGLIIQIGEWALLTACKQNKKWQEAGLPPITVSVNISPMQFFQTDLVRSIHRILLESGLEPKYLELEITEGMTMDVDSSLSKLLELKKIGVKISIDDFGTGYSSLHYLKKFPIDKLKIDRSFIRECTTDVNDESIVKTIILMAHLLKLQVIAEGVETKDQVTFLLQQMCTEAQGFYFSKPIPQKDFEAKLYVEESQ